MNSFYNLSSNLKSFTSILTIILSIMILFTVGAFLLNILFYLAPVAIIAWVVFKTYSKVKAYFIQKETKDFDLSSSIGVINSEEIIMEAIENNKVIDVEYKEL